MPSVPLVCMLVLPPVHGYGHGHGHGHGHGQGDHLNALVPLAEVQRDRHTLLLQLGLCNLCLRLRVPGLGSAGHVLCLPAALRDRGVALYLPLARARMAQAETRVWTVPPTLLP